MDTFFSDVFSLIIVAIFLWLFLWFVVWLFKRLILFLDQLLRSHTTPVSVTAKVPTSVLPLGIESVEPDSPDRVYRLSPRRTSDAHPAPAQIPDRDRWLGRALDNGISRKDFEQAEQDLARRWGFSPQGKDVYWAAINRATQAAARAGKFNELHRLYIQEARFSFLEGTPHRQLAQEANKWELREMARVLSDGLDGHVKIAVTENACPACAAQRGRRFTISEAIDKLPLPPDGCQCEYNAKLYYGAPLNAPRLGWCECGWTLA